MSSRHWLAAIGVVVVVAVAAIDSHRVASAEPPEPARPHFILPLATPTPNPYATPRPRTTPLAAFDVLVTVDSAALAASQTDIATLCKRITVGVATQSGVKELQASTYPFNPPMNVTAIALSSSSAQVCDARYARIWPDAVLYITANYNGTGAPLAIGPSSENFWENPTTLVRGEAVSSLTGNVYRGMEAGTPTEPQPHPTNRHRG